MAQIIRITSEALQNTVRRLLPSQQGFGEDLQASNVIQPIIDLTPTAEGSVLRQDLQSALSFGDQTGFNVNNATSVIINTTGFFRVFGVSSLSPDATATRFNLFSLTDGLSTKTLWHHQIFQNPELPNNSLQFDFVVFLRPGESLSAQSSNARCMLIGTTRQLATVNGDINNPTGFSFE